MHIECAGRIEVKTAGWTLTVIAGELHTIASSAIPVFFDTFAMTDRAGLRLPDSQRHTSVGSIPISAANWRCDCLLRFKYARNSLCMTRLNHKNANSSIIN
jgi:hypothetical protein